jgi:pimeloyl-ACP methyl ester carboxylesterase
VVWVASNGEESPGPPIVLVHGSMDRSGSWVRVARELRDLHTVRYDRRGYGRSREVGPGVLAQHVDDLFDVIDERPCVVAGHSYGGTVALVAASRRPDLVRAVLAYESAMPWRDFWPRSSAGANAVEEVRSGAAIGDAAERFLRRYIGDAKWEGLPERTRSERRAEGAALLTELRSVREGDVPYDATTLAVPIISARGTESEPHLQRGADALASDAPLGELAVIDGANHGGHQSHPAEVAALIRRCRARVPRTPAS